MNRILRRIAYAAALIAGGTLASACCGGESEGPGPSASCTVVSKSALEGLLEQHPFSELDSDTRAKLAAALGTDGQLCLATAAESVRCNAGDSRAADYRDCCRFTSPPELQLTGIPSTIKWSLDGAPPSLDLTIRGVLSTSISESRCLVPTCGDDAVTVQAVLQIRGSVRVGEETVELDVGLPLATPLRVSCSVVS